MMHLGLKIKIARIAKGLTQEDLAVQVNKTRPLISHIEQTGKVNIYTLHKICEVLGTTPEDLQADTGSGTSSVAKNLEHTTYEVNSLKNDLQLLKELVLSHSDVIRAIDQRLSRLEGVK